MLFLCGAAFSLSLHGRALGDAAVPSMFGVVLLPLLGVQLCLPSQENKSR